MSVLMRDPEGKLWEIPDENVEAAQNEGGYKIAGPPGTEPKVLRELPEEDLSDRGGTAFLQSAARTELRGAGLVDELSMDQAREAAEKAGLPFEMPAPPSETIAPSLRDDNARAIAAANPLEATLGGLAGEAPLLAFPGVAAGIGVGALAGGVNQEAEDAWREDRAFSTEAAALNTGYGLLGGTVAHGATALIGAAYRAGARKVSTLLDLAEERAVKKGAEDLLGDVASGRRSVREAAEAIEKGSASDPAVRELAENAKDYRATLATEQAESLGAIRDDLEQLTKRTLEPEKVAADIPLNRPAQESWAVGIRADMAEFADKLKGAATREARELGSVMRTAAKELGEATEPADWFRRVASANEDAVRIERKLAARAAKEGGAAADEIASVRQASESLRAPRPEGPEQAIDALNTASDLPLPGAVSRETAADAVKTAQDIGAKLRGGLADRTVWGRAAENEAKRFELWQTRFDDHVGAVERALFRKGAPSADKAASFLKKPTEATRQALESYLETAERIAGHGAANADEAVRLRAWRVLERVDSVRKVLAKGDVVREAEKKLASRKEPAVLTELAKDAAVSAGAEYAQDKLLGALPSGLSGAAAFALRRSKMLSRVAGLAQVTRLGDRGALRALIRPTMAAAEGLSRKVAPIAQTGVETLSKASAVAATSFASWSREPAQYTAMAERVRKLATDPAAFSTAMAESYPDLASDAPEVFAAVTGQTVRQVQFLASKLPTNPRRGIASAGAWGPSETDRWRWGLYVDAVADPDAVRNAIRNGSVRAQHVEALQAVYPARYAELKLSLMAELRALNGAGVSIPIESRKRLDLLFGGVSGDPAFSAQVAENIALARSSRLEQLQGGPAPSRAQSPPSVQNAVSPALSVLSGGAPA